MWDEEINRKIKDAADQYHPAYDDSAWNKMEQMLDEHLPRKKDRRWIIYFVPLIVLMAGVIFFVVSHKETLSTSKISEKALLKSNQEKSQHERQNLSSAEVVANPDPVKSGEHLVAAVKGENVLVNKLPVNTVNSVTRITGKLPTQSRIDIVTGNTPPASKKLPGHQGIQRVDGPLSIEAGGKSNSNIQNSTTETGSLAEKPSNEEITSPAITGNNNPLQKVNTNVAANITKEEKKAIKAKDVANVENPKDVNTNIKPKKIKKHFIQNFGIGLGVGPDVSAVKLSETGKLTASYGGELSYSFTDKFTLRSGFYVSEKIYSVDDDEYHVPQGSTWNTYLQSVDANCKVYEIPVTLQYNFGKVKNHNWFASAGLSSYFMKRESYVYYYKNPLGITYNNPWSVTNQNKHYFSVLDISGGYEYSFDKRFSIIAEPYVKLPLSGIGAGKIKLNSAGVFFTVAVKPFLK